MADLDPASILSVISVASLLATISWSVLAFYLVYLRGGRLRISSPTIAMQYADKEEATSDFGFMR